MLRIADAGELACALTTAPERGVIARGMGRSYGDAAQRAGGSVLDMTPLHKIHNLSEDGVVDADAGATLAQVIEYATPRGWFLPVTPGTKHVTLGGAVAADVHGKNHHSAGSFGQHVTGLTLVTADGKRRDISPQQEPSGFWATVGGMGLTGVILRVRLQLRRVQTAWIDSETRRARDLDALMDALLTADRAHPYTVAWIDTLTRGRQLGRGVLTAGDHASTEDLPRDRRARPLSLGRMRKLTVPTHFPSGLVRRGTGLAFNEAWFRKAPRTVGRRIESFDSFFYPLDSLQQWNRLYGSGGMVQYQFVVPLGAEDVVHRVLYLISKSQAPSLLGVLKRFGESSPGVLSFPIPGWTLAVDFAARWPALPRLLTRLDEFVLGSGGRIYLAKDSRLSPDVLRTMYPSLDSFARIRDVLDPHRRVASDLSRRLDI